MQKKSPAPAAAAAAATSSFSVSIDWWFQQKIERRKGKFTFYFRWQIEITLVYLFSLWSTFALSRKIPSTDSTVGKNPLKKYHFNFRSDDVWYFQILIPKQRAERSPKVISKFWRTFLIYLACWRRRKSSEQFIKTALVVATAERRSVIGKNRGGGGEAYRLNTESSVL